MAKKRRISQSDFDLIAEHIVAELDRRKWRRKDFDKDVMEIDRQIKMEPKTAHKRDQLGRLDPRKNWLPEIELPLQAEALETLTADARELMFPDTGPWFTSHVALTDDYLDKADFTSFIAGDRNEIPTQIDQDNADKLASGYLQHFHRQYDFRGNVDLINAEAFSYGGGVGRGRLVQKRIYISTAKGMQKEDQVIPVLIPYTIKQTYLDDREYAVMNEGHMIGPMTIFTRKVFLEDLMKQAKAGGRDTDSIEGGWLPKPLRELEADDRGFVEFIEAEGDFVIPRRSGGPIFLPGTIVTVASGKNAKKVIRLRFRQFPFNEVLLFPYHKENLESPYPTSPLRKGRPIQAAAVEALMRIMETSALNSHPPVGYDRNDLWFAQNGGPIIAPAAQWATIGEVNVHGPFGSPQELLVVYQSLLQQYSDVVGVNRARLGAQTVSHTTAFAKNAELLRGQSRTVDYVRSTTQGPLTQWLDMAYQMGLKSMRGSQMFYIDAYRGFVEVTKDQLPDKVIFEAHGSSGPQLEREIRQEKLAGLAQAIQVDQLNVQLGGQPVLNIPAIIEETLTQSGWADIDPFLAQEGQTIPPQIDEEPVGGIPTELPINI